MSSRSSRFQKPVVLLALVQALAAGCSGNGGTEPNPPDQLDTTGRLVISLVSDGTTFSASLNIDGTGRWPLRPSEDVSVDRLEPGQYRVSLEVSGVPDGLTCRVQDGADRIAQVRAGQTTAVQYDIRCVGPWDPPERPDRPDRRPRA